MTKFRSFLQNALVEYIGVYSDTNERTHMVDYFPIDVNVTY